MASAEAQIPDRSPTGPAEVEWAVSRLPVGYLQAVAFMEARAEAIARGAARELVWLLEHPPLYTAGTSARPEDLLAAARFPVFRSGRGGKFTYHGPGQRVIYLMLDVKRRSGDVRAFVGLLEAWIIAALAQLGVAGERRPGRVGIWVRQRSAEWPAGESPEAKITAIGLRLRRWVSLHGISLNVSPDLSHYAGIVPCGIAEYGVTSLAALGRPAAAEVVDEALRATFEGRFAPIRRVPAPLEGAAGAVQAALS